MTAFEDRISNSALSNIAKYGKTVSVQRYTQSAYDTATGTYTNTLTSSVIVKALVSDFNARISQIGLILKSGDKIITVAASGFDKPGIADKFTVEGETYTIVPIREGGLEIQTIYAGEIPVLYKIHGRKS